MSLLQATEKVKMHKNHKNKSIIDLPYELQGKIIEHLSAEDVESLAKTNDFYAGLCNTFNGSITEKTIYDSKNDSYNPEKVKKYKNLREILLRSLICISKHEYEEYIQMVSRQKYLRKLQINFISDFYAIVSIPDNAKWTYLTNLNLSFLAERIDTDRDLAHLFLERAKNLNVFIYENGHLSERSVIALTKLKSLHTIQWTNVLIYNPFQFKQYFSQCTSLRKVNIYYLGFMHVNLTLSILEIMLIKINVERNFDEIRLYFEQNEYVHENPLQYINRESQTVNIDTEDFIGMTNLIIPLLRRDFMNGFKITFLYVKCTETDFATEGNMQYSIYDLYQKRIKKFNFNLVHF